MATLSLWPRITRKGFQKEKIKKKNNLLLFSSFQEFLHSFFFFFFFLERKLTALL